MNNDPLKINIDPTKFETIHDYEDGMVYLMCLTCDHKFEVAVSTGENLVNAEASWHPVCPNCKEHAMTVDQALDLDAAELQKAITLFCNKHVVDNHDTVLQINFAPNNQYGLPLFNMRLLGITGPNTVELIKTLCLTRTQNDSDPNP